MAFKDQFEEKSLHWVQTALMLLNVNYFMHVHRFCLETYLLLDRLPSRDDDSHLAACDR